MDLKNVRQILKEALSRGELRKLVLQNPVEEATKINVEAVRILEALGYEGIYITLVECTADLIEIFHAAGIDTDKMFFIDGISQMYSIRKITTENIFYVDGPLSLDAILQAIETQVPKIKSEKKFVFLDSITSVLLYNSLTRTRQFSHLVANALGKAQVLQLVSAVSLNVAQDGLLAELAKENGALIDWQ